MDPNDLIRKQNLTGDEQAQLRAALVATLNPRPAVPPATLDEATFANLLRVGDLTIPENAALLRREAQARLAEWLRQTGQ